MYQVLVFPLLFVTKEADITTEETLPKVLKLQDLSSQIWDTRKKGRIAAAVEHVNCMIINF